MTNSNRIKNCIAWWSAISVSVLMGCSQSKLPVTSVAETAPAVTTVAMDRADGQAADQVADQVTGQVTGQVIDQAVKAYVDPATGELRDPPSDGVASNAGSLDKKPLATSPSTERMPAQEIVHPGGIVEVPLDASKQHSLQGCVQKDGSIKMGHSCTDMAKAKP